MSNEGPTSVRRLSHTIGSLGCLAGASLPFLYGLGLLAAHIIYVRRIGGPNCAHPGGVGLFLMVVVCPVLGLPCYVLGWIVGKVLEYDAKD
jgi:hypothetical protein